MDLFGRNLLFFQVSQELEGGNQVDTIVLDFLKAFDKVSHTLLLHKITPYKEIQRHSK